MALLGLIPSKKNNEIAELKSQIENLSLQLSNKKTNIQKDLVTIYEWNVQTRPFVSRSKSWFTSLALLFCVFILLTVLLQEFILMFVLVSLLLLLFVASTIPPEKVTHKITTHGVKYIDRIFKWSELDEYWFTMRNNDIFLNISTKSPTPSQLILMISENSQDEKMNIEQILDQFLPRRELDIRDDKIVQNFINKYTDGEIISY